VVQKEVLILPLHRQVVPWVTRKNITLVHRTDNKFTPLWTTVK
jgi:peptide/nickel transport system substrate-binding protein